MVLGRSEDSHELGAHMAEAAAADADSGKEEGTGCPPRSTHNTVHRKE